jgi:hypothetical protein
LSACQQRAKQCRLPAASGRLQTGNFPDRRFAGQPARLVHPLARCIALTSVARRVCNRLYQTERVSAKGAFMGVIFLSLSTPTTVMQESPPRTRIPDVPPDATVESLLYFTVQFNQAFPQACLAHYFSGRVENLRKPCDGGGEHCQNCGPARNWIISPLTLRTGGPRCASLRSGSPCSLMNVRRACSAAVRAATSSSGSP